MVFWFCGWGAYTSGSVGFRWRGNVYDVWRFKDLLADCFGGGFLVEAIIFFCLHFLLRFFVFLFELFFACSTYFLLESLILAQDERWRRA